MKKPQPIHSILERTLRGLEIDLPIRTHAIWGAWEEIVGDAVAGQTRPRAVRSGILFIDVSHSTWVQQLQFLKPTLLEKINTFLGASYIQDIRFKLGRIPPARSFHPRSRDWQDEDLDGSTLKRIEGLVAQIDDEETKGALRDLLRMGAKLERHRKRLDRKAGPWGA